MLTLRDSLDLIADPRNLDESVYEVFQTMLDISCRNELEGESGCKGDAESVTAVVGFGGILSGACVFRCDSNGARKFAGLMTGMDFPALDDVVKDGIGEICNMLAGTWKSKVPNLAANCGLSVPAVITGSDYKLYVQAPEFRVHRRYVSEEVRFELIIVCDGLQ
ncbi:MAG TPA: chemotaxis protein CheX [Terracidiphilus sp.]|jgi:chemotaxis protein CheX